jgi:hypothetical protein
MSDAEYKVDSKDRVLLEIELLRLLANALGINYPVRRIKLDVGLCNAANVVVESFVRNEQGQRVARLLTEEFVLHKKSEKQTPIEPS